MKRKLLRETSNNVIRLNKVDGQCHKKTKNLSYPIFGFNDSKI